MTADRNRDARTGEFVTDEYAAAHPDTTVTEHVTPPDPTPAGLDRVHVRFASGIEQTLEGVATMDPATGALTFIPGGRSTAEATP